MRVPLLDLAAQLEPMRERILAAVSDVLASGRFVLGPKVRAFEAAIAERAGVPHAIGVSSGTDALVLSLMALGAKAGDLVITSAYSFVATAGSIVRAGAQPIFIDVDEFSLDPLALEAWISSHRDLLPRVRAIVPVHLFGRAADLDRIRAVAGSIPIVEDAAQAFGASSAGARGTLGCFSFYPSKTLGGLGDGGMIITSDDALAERIRRLRNHGIEPDGLVRSAGGNFRLDELQAAVLLELSRDLDVWLEARRRRARNYRDALSIDGLTLPGDTPEHVYSQFVIRTERRDALRAHLLERGIGTEIYYAAPLPSHPAYGGEPADRWPNSARAARTNLAIPVHPALTDQQQAHVCAAIRSFFNP